MLCTLHHEFHETLEQQDREDQNMQACQRVRQPFIVSGQSAKTRAPAETPLHHPSAGQQDEALLGLGQFHHFKLDATGRRVLGRLGTGVALVYKHDFDRFPRDDLPLVGQPLYLRSVLLIGGGNMQGQQVAQGVYSHMYLTTALPLGPIIARAGATLRRGLERPATQHRGRGLGRPSLSQPQHHTQVMGDGGKHARFQPAEGLLVHGLPGWQVVGHHPPRGARPDDPA
jgi:hypothetical protein